jgi:hypothetical protein
MREVVAIQQHALPPAPRLPEPTPGRKVTYCGCCGDVVGEETAELNQCRCKPDAVTPEDGANPSCVLDLEQLKNSTTNNASVNSRSLNSSISRASHHALRPSVPFCSLEKVVGAENGNLRLEKQSSATTGRHSTRVDWIGRHK